jgi:hypothetical protein
MTDQELNRFIHDRFWSKVDKSGECWLWTASKKYKDYGQFWYKGRNDFAHRVAYELCKGAIPDGLQIDHLCRNPSCVNPDHLEAVTQRENILRGEGLSAQRARQTHCKRGHLLSEGKGRTCKVCVRKSNLASYHKNKNIHNPKRNTTRKEQRKSTLTS